MNAKRLTKVTFIVTLCLSLFSLTARQASAAVEDLSPLAQTIVEQVQNGDTAGLETTVGDITPDNLARLATEITTNTTAETRTMTLQSMARAVTRTKPLSELPAAATSLATAVGDASGSGTDTIDATMQGLIEGVRGNAGLEDAEIADVNQQVGTVGRSAAAAFISSAEGNEAADIEAVADAVARGGAAGLAVQGLDRNLLRGLSRNMLDGGVGAARESNKPTVSRAMLQVLAEIVPPELRPVLPGQEDELPGEGIEDGEDEGEGEEAPATPAEPVAPPPPVNPVEPEDVSNF